jgi:hypothetical protein
MSNSTATLTKRSASELQAGESSFLTTEELSIKCNEQIGTFWIAMNVGEGGSVLDK